MRARPEDAMLRGAFLGMGTVYLPAIFLEAFRVHLPTKPVGLAMLAASVIGAGWSVYRTRKASVVGICDACHAKARLWKVTTPARFAGSLFCAECMRPTAEIP
jgi:hypothetical protein